MANLFNKRKKRPMPIQRLLEWAFAEECARLDFAEEAYRAPIRRSVGSEARLIEQAALGACIDTSRGRSYPHHDAEIVASVVARLGPEHGGVGMAIAISDYARAKREPDWMRGAAPRLVPMDWHENQWGRRGRTAPTGETFRVRNRKGVVVERKVFYTPCTYEPTAAQIARARRHYLEWYGALLEIGHQLTVMDALTHHEITKQMPQLRPWAMGQQAECPA